MEFPSDRDQVDPETGEVQPAFIPVRPTHFKSSQTGVLLEVENPEVWVYAQEDQA